MVKRQIPIGLCRVHPKLPDEQDEEKSNKGNCRVKSVSFK